MRKTITYESKGIILLKFIIIIIFISIFTSLIYPLGALAQNPFLTIYPYTGYSLYSRLYHPLLTVIPYSQRWGIPAGWNNNDYFVSIGDLSPYEYSLYQGYSNYFGWSNNFWGRFSDPYSHYNPILEPLNPIGQYIGKMNQLWYDMLPDKWKPQTVYDEEGRPFTTTPETPWGYGIPGWGTLAGWPVVPSF